MDYKKHLISSGVTVREAMQAIDNVEPKIVFLMDENIRLLASLTDGDIRRYLLRGGQLGDCVEEAGHQQPRVAHSRAEAAQMYHQKNYVAIPILDADSRVVDVYMGEGARGQRFADLRLPIVINAGGKGTRLEPYTKILPKPLIPVGEIPIIEHIMQQFDKYGCTEFSIIVNYKKEIMKAYFAENEKNYDISWFDEEKPLGTGGGLRYLKGKIDRTFFFTNCDNLLLSNLESIVRFHRENQNVVTMICAYKNVKIPYGVIDMGLNGKIESMREKPEFSFLTNTGIYILEPEVIDEIGDNEKIGFPDVVERVRKKGKNVSIYPISEKDWLDMGQLEELEKMRKRLYGE